MTKKCKRIIIGSTLGMTIATSIVIPIIIWRTANNNDLGDWKTLAYVAPKEFKQPIISKYVDGMINDSKRYDELIAERNQSIMITNERGALKFEADDVLFQLDESAVTTLKKYLSDGEIKKLIFDVIKNSNFNLTSKYHSFPISPLKLTCNLTAANTPFGANLGEASGANEITIQVFQIIKQLTSESKLTKGALINQIKDTYFHELGHRLQDDLSQSRSAIWGQNIYQKRQMRQLLNPFNHGSEFKNKEYNPYQNLLYSLKRQDVFQKMCEYINAKREDGTLSLSNKQIINYDQIVERYYDHNALIVKNIGLNLYDNMGGGGTSFFGYGRGVWTEFLTRIQIPWTRTYDNWDKVINEFDVSFGEQVRTGLPFGLNPYPLDTSFSRKFMGVYFKYFMGIGDANNLEVKKGDGTNQDHIWFGATSTALSKKAKQVKLVYPDGTFTLDLQTKDYPIGWNYQPWTVDEKFYKYVARAKYGYMNIPHHDALPQKITFLDQDNNELSNEDVQLLHGEVEDNTNVMVRYIFNDVTSAWEENYQNT